jgi:hypothetical protein
VTSVRRCLAVLCVAAAGASAAPAALAKGRIPQHFAYAAEVRVTVTYDATFTRDSVFDEPCGDANGDTIDQQYPAHEQEHLDRTIVFRHITVPVVAPSELGKAAKRLALKPTITDPGTVQSDGSTYDLSGDLISDDGCPGTTTHYDCPGTVTNLPKIASLLISGGDGFDAELYEIPVAGDEVADPLSCDALEENDIPTMLGIDAKQAHPGWGAVVLHSGLNPRLYALRTKPEVTWSVPVNGADPCDGDAVSCTQTVTGSAHIAIQRLFRYFTRHSYAK